VTFDQVAAELNGQGFTAFNGKAFTGNTVKGILHRQKNKKREKLFYSCASFFSSHTLIYIVSSVTN
jgi:hypothetical protein